MQNTLTTTIQKILEELGYDTEAPGKLKGKSNITHTFNILATKPNGQKIAIEIINQDKPQDLAIIALYAKAYDTKPNKTILITNTNINQEARTLAQHYQIHIIPANPDLKQLKQELNKFIKTTIT